MDLSLRAHTTDGLELSVALLPRPEGMPVKAAVILCHGMAVNGRMMDFPGQSLARYLRSLGFDVFVPELRGHGRSEHVGGGWDFEDHLRYDMPAILELVTSRLAKDQPLFWVGHSMGGILLMAHAIDALEASPIQGGVVLGGALDYRPGETSWYRHLLPLIDMARLFPGKVLPWTTLVRALAPFTGFLSKRLPSPAEDFFFSRENTHPSVVRGFFADCGAPVPVRLVLQLSSLFEKGDLDLSGQHYQDRAEAVRMPTLFFGGTADVQCGLGAVQKTAASFWGSTFVGRGRDFGQAYDYGHIDLVLGKHAEEDVWRPLAHFLQRLVDAEGVGEVFDRRALA